MTLSLTDKLDKILKPIIAKNVISAKVKVDAYNKHYYKQQFIPLRKESGPKYKEKEFKKFDPISDKKKKPFVAGDNKEGLVNKQVRVLRGSMKTGTHMQRLSKRIKTTTDPFRFGNFFATSIARIKEKKSDFVQLQEVNQAFFICSYVDESLTYIQLEDLKNNIILDTFILQNNGFKGGVYSLKSYDKNKAVGIFADQIILLEVDNFKLKTPIFLNIFNVSFLDIDSKSHKMAIAFLDGSIQIGKIINGSWKMLDVLKFSFSTIVTALGMRGDDCVFIGLANGQVIMFRKLGDEWIRYKEYYAIHNPVKIICTWRKNDAIVISGDEKNAIILKPNQNLKFIRLKTSPKYIERDKFQGYELVKDNKKLIYMRFTKKGNLVYAYSNGAVGKLKDIINI